MKLKTASVGIALFAACATSYGAVTVNAGANGFTGWTENNTSGNGSQNGRFLGASTTGMDTAGVSWGLYANSGQTSSNTYVFGAPLAVGETVTISVAIGFINTGGTVGFGLQNSSSTNRFESYYIGGHPDNSWKLNDAGGQENITGVSTTFNDTSWKNSTPNFATFSFTLGAANTYSFSVNGNAVTNTGLTLNASDIDRIRIFNFNAGSGGDFNQYFNSLSVVPEPSAALLGGLGALVLLRRRRF